MIICDNCIHQRRKTFGKDLDKKPVYDKYCIHPNAYNPVDGYPPLCEDERTAERNCGTKGFLWSKKEDV